MRSTGYRHSSAVAFAVVCAALLALPQIITAQAQRVTGQAVAMRATVSGLLGTTTTELAATGSLVDHTDARQASQPSGVIPGIGDADVLRASTISSISAWAPEEEVASGASLANLSLSVAGVRIAAEFVMARATATVGGGSVGQSDVEGLTVNGLPITVSGAENQAISLAGIRLVINEVARSASGVTVNALHITSSDGLVNVVVASATAGVH